MSLYKDASLVMIPSAYKDGKLYSIRPTDGSGDFTFSRGSNLAATRVDVNGLIEKGRENLLLQSNQFDTTWTLTGSTLVGGQTDKDGGTDAWQLTSSNTGQSFVKQVVSSSGVATCSVYAKAGTANFIAVYAVGGGDPRTFFDLQNGTTETSANNITNDIEDIGNGWYKCSLVFDKTIADVRLYIADSDNVFNSGNGSSVYIQDAQLEQGLVATDYIETGTSAAQSGILEDMPRLDYSASCPSLLLEPQRLNLVSQSEYMQYSNNINVSVNDNETTSPEGVVNAAQVIPNSTNSNHIVRSNNLAGLTSQGTYSVSVFAKQNGYKYINLGAGFGSTATPLPTFDLNTGTIVSNSSNGTIEDYGNGWYKCTAIIQIASTALYPIISILNNSQSGSYVGDGTSAVYLYGHQIEQGSYPTSYIPTYGSSVTRSAEEYCKVNNIGDFPNEYTLFFEMEDIEASQNNSVIMDLYSTTANTISVRTYETSGDGRLRFVDIVNNSTLFYLEHTSRKYCIRVNGTSVDGFTNGALAVSATAGSSMNNLDDLNIRCGSAQRSLSKYKQIVAFPTALTDSECIALTTL